MNNEEIDYWLRYFSNHNHGFMSEDGKKITLFKMFQELKELQYLLKIKNDYINELEAYKYNMDRDYLRLEKENQELKEKIDGIYEERTYLYNKLSTEKEQLNSLVNSCQEEIRQLKKQLEEYKKLGFEHLNDKYNKLEKSEYDDKF